MAKQFKALEPQHQSFIKQQKLYFVGTTAATGSVNISPKGGDSLRIISPHQVVWRNLTGSDNKTAAHIAQTNCMTLMFCAF